MRPAHYLLAVLSQHAKIHKELDELGTRYRRLLQRIEEKQIASYRHDGKYRRLEELKEELLSIRFLA